MTPRGRMHPTSNVAGVARAPRSKSLRQCRGKGPPCGGCLGAPNASMGSGRHAAHPRAFWRVCLSSSRDFLKPSGACSWIRPRFTKAVLSHAAVRSPTGGPSNPWRRIPQRILRLNASGGGAKPKCLEQQPWTRLTPAAARCVSSSGIPMRAG
jgi:hypothetical protein